MNPNPTPRAHDDYDDYDALPLESRYPVPNRPEHGALRRWLAFYAARAMVLIGILAVMEGIRTDISTDRFVYPLFLARSYLFFPSYVSVGLTDEVSLTWRLLVAGWILGLIAFVWFSPEKLFALIAYISLPVLLILGSYQLTGTGSTYWHAGSVLIDGTRYHQVAVYRRDTDALEQRWFQCNDTGFLCIRTENPNARPPAQ